MAGARVNDYTTTTSPVLCTRRSARPPSLRRLTTSHRPETPGAMKTRLSVCASPCGDHMPLLFHALTSEMQLSSVGRGADRRAPPAPFMKEEGSRFTG
ncbi:unnamed protein product [Boreogadus saida]